MRPLTPIFSLDSGSPTKHLPLLGVFLSAALALGCTAAVDSGSKRSPGGGGGNAPTSMLPTGTGAMPGSGSASGVGPTPGAGGAGGIIPTDCNAPVAPRAPIRRLTRFEYSNTLRDLVGDTMSPGNGLPAEERSNGFSNDADKQSVSSLLLTQYVNVAEEVALRATAAGGDIQTRYPCTASVPGSAAAETECVSSLVAPLAAQAYRRPLAPGEAEELIGLFQSLRTGGTDFLGSLAGVVQALLIGPDFLYRPEFGVAVPGRPDLMRPTGPEMATRLSYLYFGSLPDPELAQAAARGELDTPEGVKARATSMLSDARAEANVGFFFDNLLPIARVAGLSRDPAVYPTFSRAIGSLMRQETQAFLKNEIFQANGSLESIYTAPYTFLNEELATFYGIPGVMGADFRQVPIPDTSKRLGLLTQGGVLMGTVATNVTNPVTRGAFIVTELLCQDIPLPNVMFVPPDPYSFPTARERFAAHSKDPGCAVCHSLMDPAGLAQENFDAVGLWRDQENGVTIDATGQLPLLGAPFNGPVELTQRVVATAESKTCFAHHFMDFAYGRTLAPQDKCTVDAVQSKFTQAGYNVKSLLTALAESDAFLYLSAAKE